MLQFGRNCVETPGAHLRSAAAAAFDHPAEGEEATTTKNSAWPFGGAKAKEAAAAGAAVGRSRPRPAGRSSIGVAGKFITFLNQGLAAAAPRSFASSVHLWLSLLA